VRDQVSHPYRTTRKIRVLIILILKFLDNKREYVFYITKLILWNS
jgi:hypothetical protein